MNVYLVQTVSSRPRPWSSYTNISSKEVRNPTRMNSAEEISKYNDHSNRYCSSALVRRTGGTSYDFPEKSPKKEKKWSLGSLFRRKKKNDSESTSEEENKSKIASPKRKKKTEKRKRTNKAIAFDHVVVPPSSRSNTLSNGYKNHDDPAGVLSEPSFTGRTVTRNFIPASDFANRLLPPKDSQDSLNRSINSLGSPSVSSLGRRCKKEGIKARAEARRDNSKGEESSDDDSQRSAFKSDDSLTKHRDGSFSKRSRGARTQRYLNRRSKDEEGRDQLRACKSDIEHDQIRSMQHLRIPDERMQKTKTFSKSPILSPPKYKLCYTNSAPSSVSQPNFSGLSTIPPSHSSHSKYRTINLTNGSSQKSSSFHDYNDAAGSKCAPADLNNHRSLSCDANIHNATPSPDHETEIVHVQFPLGRPFSKRPNVVINQHLNQTKKQPPPPPPRDPRRILSVQNADGRPVSYSFETGYPLKNASDQQLNKLQSIPEPNPNYNLNPGCRSTSEDHISLEPAQRVPLVPRPSSTTPETNKLQKLARTYTENGENANNYRYLADKNPRSRKPICIQSCNAQNGQQNKSQNMFDFWRQKDEEVSRLNARKSTPGSPLMFTAQTHVRTNIFLPNGVKVETETINPAAPEMCKREGSPFRPITPSKAPSPPQQNGSLNDELDEIQQRKSANLEEALDELEAIYNSLHLGDEDLLENAEKREAAAALKRKDAAFESYPNSVMRGNLSDSSFCYESGRRKRFLKRSEPDPVVDDMAYRKLNKERYNTISDPQSVVSKVSYLLTSPVFNAQMNDYVPRKEKTNNKNKEPDVTFDDVVYRNVKHTNNSLKIIDPQPLFGIPVGPVLPGSNSDYLHATPEVTPKCNYQKKKIPDVVKDDLAYRNLRKDLNKEPALPQTNLSPEDYLNNNNNKTGESLKKKNKAVRSLSANIYNLMYKDWKPTVNPFEDVGDSKQNISDVADALEIARQILREKENKINATRQAFMSDGELKYRKFRCGSPTERQLNFLNEIKSNSLKNENIYHHRLQVNIPTMEHNRLEAKPPTPDRRSSRPSTKESTPIPTSPSEEAHLKKQPEKSSLDDLLTSIALEARETSERIANELMLEKLEKENEDEPSVEEERFSPVQERIPEKTLLKDLEEDATSCSLTLHLDEGDSTAEHAKLCEKLLECVVENGELRAANTLEPEPSEEVESIRTDPLLPETVANVVLTPNGGDKSKSEVHPIATEVFSESDHDYVNIQSAEEVEKETEAQNADNRVPNPEISSSTEIDEEERELLLLDDDSVSADICVSPLEKHKDELVATFKQLKLGDALLFKGKKPQEENIEQTDKGGGEECVSVEYATVPTTTTTAKIAVADAGEACAAFKEHQNVQFHLDSENFDSLNLPENLNIDTEFDSLKSPKLVQNLNTNLCGNVEFSENCTDRKLERSDSDSDSKSFLSENFKTDSSNGPNSNSYSVICRPESRTGSRDMVHTLDETRPCRSWYEDPAVIALACSCGIACSSQLPLFDVVFVLGLLFAVISLIVAMLVRT